MEDVPEVMGLPAGSLEDKDLTLAYQRGEDGAYQAIYDRYCNRVHSVCRRMLGNNQDAQDAAQESFLRVYQALGRFNGRYQLGPWITRIATNVCLDHIRAKSRRPKDVLPIELIDLDGNDETEIDGPDEIVIRKSESRRVRKVLESLPPMHRAAIVLRDFEGLSYQEVAVALQITECQVKALIHRARQGFKRSWTSIGLSALVPTHLFQRLRKVHTPKVTGRHTSSMQHFAESFTASAAPAATSCSAAFSQCGQFVADKFAPALTAVALGAASLAGPAAVRTVEAPSAESGPLHRSTDVEFAKRADNVKPAVRRFEPVQDRAKPMSTGEEDPVAEDDAHAAQQTAAPATPPVTDTPPAATPTVGPTPAAPAQKAEEDPGSQPVPSGPPVVAMALSPTTGSSRVPDSLSATFRCTNLSVAQFLTTSVSRESSTWPTRLELSANATEFSLQVIVTTSRSDILFATAGALVASERSGDHMRVEFAGTYRSRNMEAKDTLGVPLSGNFQLQLTLDCASRNVIAESLNFEA